VSGPIAWAESGRVPDPLVRMGIRGLLRAQLARQAAGTPEQRADAQRALREELRARPIAECADAANDQHYALPPEFFRLMLGPRLKYSCCWWDGGAGTLARAEDAMLALTCERARLADGMDVLDLGCGWGSLSLWIAERHPRCRVTAVSNSAAQRGFIEAECRRRGLSGVTVVTADVAAFAPSATFDRVISIEMLEHVRNHDALFERAAAWLRPGGMLFAHVFVHRDTAYLYDTEGGETWMARHFFTGGMMPSDGWLAGCDRDLVEIGRWRVSGVHYARTLEAWLRKLDRARGPALAALAALPGDPAPVRLQRWRMFLMACAELFDWNSGSEWYVSHSLHAPRRG
jgi:cyclopropane-fatty-acyl-phospholipid synthase